MVFAFSAFQAVGILGRLGIQCPGQSVTHFWIYGQSLVLDRSLNLSESSSSIQTKGPVLASSHNLPIPNSNMVSSSPCGTGESVPSSSIRSGGNRNTGGFTRWIVPAPNSFGFLEKSILAWLHLGSHICFWPPLAPLSSFPPDVTA